VTCPRYAGTLGTRNRVGDFRRCRLWAVFISVVVTATDGTSPNTYYVAELPNETQRMPQSEPVHVTQTATPQAPFVAASKCGYQGPVATRAGSAPLSPREVLIKTPADRHQLPASGSLQKLRAKAKLVSSNQARSSEVGII